MRSWEESVRAELLESLRALDASQSFLIINYMDGIKLSHLLSQPDAEKLNLIKHLIKDLGYVEYLKGSWLTAGDIQCRMNEIFIEEIISPKIRSGSDLKSRALDKVDGVGTDIAIFGQSAEVVDGIVEGNDLENGSPKLTASQKKRIKAKQKAEKLGVELGDFVPKTALEKKFYKSLKLCFTPERSGPIIDNQYRELSYEFRLHIFQTLRKNSTQSMLPETIGVMMTVLVPEKFLSKGHEYANEEQLRHYVHNIDEEFKLLINTVIEKGLVKVDNIKDWLLHLQLSDNDIGHKLRVFIQALYECDKVDVSNCRDWSYAMIQDGNITLYDSCRLIIIEGVRQGKINLTNGKEWYDVSLNKSFKKYDFVDSVLSGLKIAPETLLSDLSEWYTYLQNISALNQSVIADVFISQYGDIVIEEHKFWKASMVETMIIITMFQIFDSDLEREVRPVLDKNPDRQYFEYLILNYLYENKATISTIRQILTDKKICILKVYNDLSSIKELFRQGNISDEYVERFYALITPMDDRARECLVGYVKQNSLIKDYLSNNSAGLLDPADIVRVDISNINKLVRCFDRINKETVFAQLFQLLCERDLYDQWPNYYQGGIHENKLFLYCFTKDAIACGKINLDNFHDWFTQVKSLDLNISEYTTLYNYIIGGLVDNKNMPITDIKYWQDQLRLEFYSLPFLKTHLVSIEPAGEIALNPKALKIEGSELPNLLWYHFQNQDVFQCDIVSLLSRSSELYDIIVEESFFAYARILTAEPIVKSAEVGERLRCLVHYGVNALETESSNHQRQQVEPISFGSVSRFLSGDLDKLSIPDDIAIIANINAQILVDIIKGQLGGLVTKSKKSRGKNLITITNHFFNLLDRVNLVLNIMAIHNGDMDGLYLQVNKMVMNFAFEYKFLEPNRESLDVAYKKSNFNYNDLMESIFSYLVSSPDLSMQKLTNWIDAFESVLPEKWSESQNLSVTNISCDFSDNRTYISALCLMAFSYWEDSFSENRGVLEQRYIEGGDVGPKQLQVMLIIHSLDERQINYMLESDLDSRVMNDILSRIDGGHTLTKYDIARQVEEVLWSDKSIAGDKSVR